MYTSDRHVSHHGRRMGRNMSMVVVVMIKNGDLDLIPSVSGLRTCYDLLTQNPKTNLCKSKINTLLYPLISYFKVQIWNFKNGLIWMH